MHLAAGRWKAYDVSLLGISAVQIYRAQFQAVLRTHSPAQAIALVRSRIGEQ
jgi:ABC-type transporter MlaC component